MTRGATARLLLLVPVAGVAVLMVVTADDLRDAPIDYLVDAATGVILVLAGLIAWDRRPAWRTGPLLVLAGYLWYVGSLYELMPDGSFIPYLGFAFRGYYDLILAFVVLAVPGRPPAATERGRGRRRPRRGDGGPDGVAARRDAAGRGPGLRAGRAREPAAAGPRRRPADPRRHRDQRARRDRPLARRGGGGAAAARPAARARPG